METKNVISLYAAPAQAGAHLVKSLRYKQKSSEFGSRWSIRNFSLTSSFRPHYGHRIRLSLQQKRVPGIVDKGGRCVGLTNLPPSYDNCLEIWESQPSESLRALPGLYWICFTFTVTFTFTYVKHQ